MAEGHANVAQHGAVGQVALQAADGEFLGEVGEHGVGHAQVAFRVFEVDGVDLVGHGAGAHLSSFDLLLEVVHRDILPEVAVKVYHYGIDALECIEYLAQSVVVADLGGILFTLIPVLKTEWLS